MSRFHPILIIKKRSLDANDTRQCLRIAFGGALGFLLCKLMGWNYGAFFTVTPLLLLGLVPQLNAHIVRQFVANVALVSVSVLVLQGLFGDKQVLPFSYCFHSIGKALGPRAGIAPSAHWWGATLAWLFS